MGVTKVSDSNRIHSLDSLRGISSLIVVIFHCLISFPVFYAAFNFQHYNNTLVKYLTITPLHTLWVGPEAVLLFFVLSGFVLSLPYLKGEGLPYRKYVVKRFFRIYIPYIIIMFVYIIVIALLKDYRDINTLSEAYNVRWDHPVTLKAVISYVFMLGYDMTNVNGVIWSLVHEMRISLIFPVIMLLVNRFNWVKALIYGVGSSMLGYILLKIGARYIFQGMYPTLVSSFCDTFYYCTFFVLGATLAKYRSRLCSFVRPMKPAYKLLLFILVILLINFKWVFHGMYLSISNKLSFIRYGIAGDWTVALGVILLFILVLSSKTAEALLTKRFFVWLGKISYSVYLVHVIVIMLLSRYLSRLIPMEFAFALVPVLTLPLAHLAYKYIELPAINAGKRLTAGQRRAIKGMTP